MRVFSKAELNQHDGRDGSSYVAYQGKVYDVSLSFHWRKGTHQVVHTAGNDLTEVLDEAPHGPDLLFQFPVVGELAEKP